MVDLSESKIISLIDKLIDLQNFRHYIGDKKFVKDYFSTFTEQEIKIILERIDIEIEAIKKEIIADYLNLKKEKEVKNG